MRATHNPQRLAEALGPVGSRDLLGVLLRSTDDRVALIGRLYPRGGGSRELAETLIDLEIDGARRHEVIEALLSIVPPEDGLA
jgi:hypothetical protein